jgi:autotransporter-associated beta strand protein
MTRPFVLLPLLLASAAQADPQITSWFTQNSGKYSRVYTTTANRTNGVSATTWNTGGATLPHTSPSYADVYSVSYSNNWVYVKYSGIPSYVIGPWLNPQGAVGNFWPGTQAGLRRFPRTPAVQAGVKDSTAAGASGIFVNGVAAFNALDGQAWDGSAIQGQAQHTNATYYWHRNAPVAEGYNFDYALGHQLPAGLYHNHQDPIALRYQLGDHVTYNSSTKNYSVTSGTPAAHSPLIGWAHDGYPIYGPYGYGTAMDAGSGVRRMVSGYVKRNGSTTGVDSVTTNTTTMPAWYTRYRTNHNLATSTAPARSTDTGTYPIGTFAQDWSYLGDLIKTGSTHYAQGTDFDLNEYNVRYCVTPEFPSGTWAYFITLDSSNAATYPYVFGFEFYGDATGGSVASISESVTTQFTGGPNTPLTFTGTPTVDTGTVTMTWNSVEGGTYSIDASTDNTNWTSKATGLVASDKTRSTTYAALSTGGTEYGRVQRTALATYDTTGVGSATVSQTATTSYLTGANTAPTLTSISTLSGASEDTAFTISYETLAAAANEVDPDGTTPLFRIEGVSSGTLTKGGSAVTGGTTTLATGESVVWTPATNATGIVGAFTVKAYDGTLASSTTVTVNVQVASVNDAPTLTSISNLTGAAEDTPFTISYATLAAAANESDEEGAAISFRVEGVSSGSLTKNGTAVTAGVTTLASGESLVWTPASGASGTIAAFTVKAHDGNSASSTAVTVNVEVTGDNDAPTLNSVSTLTGASLNTAFTISYTTLAAAANEADPDGTTPSFRIEGVNSGTLTKNGSAVSAGSTTLSSGESVVWTPASGFTGTTAAFTVKAWDGALASSTAVAVNVTVSASASVPQLTSWYTAQAGKYARIQETDAEAVAGTSKTTWTRTTGMFTLAQTTPAYAGPTQIDYSTNWVYVRTPSLGTYTMGPWYNDAAKSQLFINVPKNQGIIIRIPRGTPTIPTTKTQINGLNIGGVMQPAAGYYVDGVSLYDPTDGFSYSGGTETSPGTGQWHRDAYVNESITFDYSMAHQQNTGFYHNHANPLALRYQLGDAVSFNNATKKYAETMSPTAHSPIVAWMIDGLPVYGPYGYSTAMDAGSGVRRMIGGFVKRDGTTTGVDNITTAGRTLPAWMLRNNGNTSAAGPTVNTTYPLGRYIQDWAYLGDLQKSAGANYQQGVDFDLNEYNVRYCVTPEFPNGTWAYFVNITSTGTPQFPYMCNRWFYGTPTGGKVNSITETVTNHMLGGPNRPLTIPDTPQVNGTSVTLTWNAVEGGTYSVDASTNGTTWTSKATGLTVSNANKKSNVHTALGTSGIEHGRVQRTALATYDTTGVVTPTVSQTATTSYELGMPNVAPTLGYIDVLTGATEDTAFTITYETLLAASDAADANGDSIRFRVETVFGTLAKNGTQVTAGSTTIAAGESLTWTPLADFNSPGLLAFEVRAFDGSLASSSDVPVMVEVAPTNDTPTLGSITTISGAEEDTPFTLTYEQLAAAADEADVDGDDLSFRIESIFSVDVTKNGVPVSENGTTIAAGESVVVAPHANLNGNLQVFTVKAYDGQLASPGAIQVIALFAAVNDRPVLTVMDSLAGGIEDQPYAIPFGTLRDSSDASDLEDDIPYFRVVSINSGTLTKNGLPVVPGSTYVDSGESFVWTPSANAVGILPAFAIEAWDGELASVVPVQVNIAVDAAADFTEWDGGAGTGAWGTAANWASDALPKATDELRFLGSSPYAIELGADRTAEAITIGGNTAYSFTGGTLTLVNLKTISPSTGSLIHSVSSAISLIGETTVDIASSATLHLSGSVSGSILTKTGSGTLILSGSTTVTGLTIISEGTLQVGNSGTTGSLAGNIINNGTLVFKRSNLHDITGVISGTGTVIQNGGSNARFSGENTFTGPLTVISGNVAVGNGGSGGSLATQSIVNGGNLIFNRTTEYSYGGVISGTGTVFKVNNNTLTLSGANTYGGHTQIEGGTLVFGSIQNLGTGQGYLKLNASTLKWAAGSSADISLRADGVTPRTVKIDAAGGTFDTNGNDVALSSPIGDGLTGALMKAGAGTLTLASAPTYKGDTIVAAGTLAVNQSSFEDGSDISITSGATLHLNFTGADAVGELLIDGQRQVRGTWGSLTSDAEHKTSLIAGTGMLLVNQGSTYFEAWTSGSGLTGADALPDADPDRDGRANVLEWMLGGNPATPDAASHQPAVAKDATHLTVTFSRNDDSEGELASELQYTTDFVTWESLNITSNEWSSPDGTSLSITENDDAPDTITVKIPNTGNARMFVRIFAEID